MIDPKIQSELREKFNPDGSLLRDTQLRMLEMLQFIDRICNENNIPYWLSSGTCLGAVRHGGFIPWDDDVDIEMMEKDYRRFSSIVQEIKDSDYVLQTSETDSAYFPKFGKLRDTNSIIREKYQTDHQYKYNGLFIDIFPMKESSSKRIHRLGYYPLLLVTFGLPKLYYTKTLTTYIQKLGHIIINSVNVILGIFQLIGKKKYIRHVSPNFYSLPRVKNEIFPLQRVLFENIYLPVPGNVGAYLIRLFGSNYMELPPLEKVKKHIAHIKILK
ncbi:MAG: LicD family protein [Bacteroides sp.]|nr:LicD family protein [Bacteroides sp.]